MRHRLSARRALAATFAFALGATALAATAAPAAADDTTAHDLRAGTRAALAETVSPGLVDAVGDMLGLTDAQTLDRLTTEAVAMRTQPVLAFQLGRDYGGLWIGEGIDEVHVAITDSSRADEVTKQGYIPELVTHAYKELRGFQSRLDGGAAAPDGVTGWHVDVATNDLVVLAKPSVARDARAWAKAQGVPGDALRVETTTATPRPYADIRGGDAYYINNSARCSVGFAVVHPSRGDGFVSAGHCGDAGDSVTGGTGAPGTFIISQFPGSDYSYIDAGSGWVATPYVTGSSQQVADSNVAPAGSSVCRSGSTTGYHCGSIQQLHTSVTYPQGTVSDVTRTNVCAEPGDSGGSFISGASAQGMTSGGSGNCSSGGTTYFQPVNEALSASGAQLKTTGGGDPGPGPGGCDGLEENYSGSLSGTGSEAFEPNGTYFYSGSGNHAACLEGPSGTDFDLYLWKWNGSSWGTVASSLSSSSHEEINYNGGAGYYAYRIYSYSGSGSYAFAMTRP